MKNEFEIATTLAPIEIIISIDGKLYTCNSFRDAASLLALTAQQLPEDIRAEFRADFLEELNRARTDLLEELDRARKEAMEEFENR